MEEEKEKDGREGEIDKYIINDIFRIHFYNWTRLYTHSVQAMWNERMEQKKISGHSKLIAQVKLSLSSHRNKFIFTA